MAVKSFTIDLIPKDMVYTTGDTISGEVKLVLNSQIKLTSLMVCFSGKGKVECARGKSIYVGKEEYYSDTVYLLNEVQVRNMGCVLRPGSYSFPFAFLIPVDADLPGSHSGKRGYIRYTVEAQMQKPDQIVSDTTIVTVPVTDFVVIEQHLLTSQTQQHTLNIGQPCCTSGTISITARVNQGGYYIGDEVLVSLYIDNRTGNDVIEAEMYLRQLTTYSYRTKRPEKQDKEKRFSCIHTTGVAHGHDSNMEDLKITIPEIKPTSLSGIIQTSYSIEIIIHFDKKFIKDPQFSFPVVIGNVHSTQIDRLIDNQRHLVA